MKPIERRDFLKGSALVLGGAAVGVLPQLAEAATTTTPKVVPNLYRWDGTRFVRSARTGIEPALQGLKRIELMSVGPATRLRGIDQIVTTSQGSFVFHAWTAHPKGAARVAWMSEHDSAQLRLILVDGTSDIELPLHEGIYVLTLGSLSGVSASVCDDRVELLDARGPLRGSYQVLRVTSA